ncbi:MAG: deoxyguanosinetriphosphate triphosphohydrolase [Myxococcales bacterium]|nr:deoxyguanosinetriphosphate triphosphohydrolase [Myxococcales bacterium]
MAKSRAGKKKKDSAGRMDWSRLMSRERFRTTAIKDEQDRNGRTPFQIDLDRIVYSQPFRRLQDKTQVHPLSENDHVRRRLTHSIEVASVGRTLGLQVGRKICERDKKTFADQKINLEARDFADVLQAACLAHDIGNPPFGHFGEDAIREWFRHYLENEEIEPPLPDEKKNDFLLFEGNAQGLRVLTRKESRPEDGGLQLTYATLGALTKYPWDGMNPHATKKLGILSSEKDTFRKIADNLGLLPASVGAGKLDSEEGGLRWHRHPLAYLVEAADDISYRLSDLEDAVELNLITYEEVRDVYASVSIRKEAIEARPTKRMRLEYYREVATSKLISDVVRIFLEHEDEIMRGAYFGELLQHSRLGKSLVLESAKNLAEKKAFKHEKKVKVETAAFEVLSTLLKTFSDAVVEGVSRSTNGDASKKTGRVLDLMGNSKPEMTSVHESLLFVTDFICGMTDRYAWDLFKQIRGIAF